MFNLVRYTFYAAKNFVAELLGVVSVRVKYIGLFMLLLCLGTAVGSLSTCWAQDNTTTTKTNPLSNIPYYFDAGAQSSTFKTDHMQLTENDFYQAEKGYGWEDIVKPQTFTHSEWERSRDQFSIDGLIADRFTFQIDLPKAEWWLILWMDAGLEDSSSVSVTVNGEKQANGLQSFTPTAEKRTEIQKIYRVSQHKVTVKENGLSFTLARGNDKVRLLGFALLPEPAIASGQKIRQIDKKLKEAGRFNSKIDLEAVKRMLSELPDEPKYKNYQTYWLQQLDLLEKAETYFNYRGWSWATQKTGMGLFDHLHQSVMLYDGLLQHEEAQKNPLYERALWYRGRLLYWLWLERGTYREKNAAYRDLEEMKQRHPNHPIVRMYNGEKIDTPDPFDKVEKPPNAPNWAFMQWEIMNRLKHIADWWVLEQQAENGELGGKFGDDVEILRWWSPLILSGDSIAYRGWKKLADGVWNSRKVYKGYAKNVSDVEHASEFIADTAPVMAIYTDEPIYTDRLSYSADYFKNLWTGFTINGRRHFKSAWFSSTEVETDPPKNRDVPYNARAVKAVRYYAWKTADSTTIKALAGWADAWLEAAQSTQKNKPKWILPPSVEYPTEKINGSEPTWYKANMFWDYFDWSGSTALLDQFLFTWSLTGDDKYLVPITKHLELVKKHEKRVSGQLNQVTTGSELWAANKLLHSEGFWNVIGVWRLLTGNQRFDELIKKYGSPYAKYRITGDPSHLVNGMTPFLKTVRYNTPMLTTEVIHTDRVYIAPGRTREANILQAMITGYGISESSSPYIAVSWEKASRDLAMLVTEATDKSLGFSTWLFSEDAETAGIRLWQLSPGRYAIHLKNSGNKTGKKIKEITVHSTGEYVELPIPAQQKAEFLFTKAGDK